MFFLCNFSNLNKLNKSSAITFLKFLNSVVSFENPQLLNKLFINQTVTVNNTFKTLKVFTSLKQWQSY